MKIHTAPMTGRDLVSLYTATRRRKWAKYEREREGTNGKTKQLAHPTAVLSRIVWDHGI